MSTVNLRKTAKVSLIKGQRVCLTKSVEKGGDPVRFAFVGANWSALEDGSSVDLDSSILVYDESKRLIDSVTFSQLTSKCGAIKHSGDDREGDVADDGLDNEVIKIDLSNINPRAHYLVSILNSYTQHRFCEVPNIELRIYTNESGRVLDVENVLVDYKLDGNTLHAKSKSVVLGHFYKHGTGWKFSADGVSTEDKSISEVAESISRGVIQL